MLVKIVTLVVAAATTVSVGIGRRQREADQRMGALTTA